MSLKENLKKTMTIVKWNKLLQERIERQRSLEAKKEWSNCWMNWIELAEKLDKEDLARPLEDLGKRQKMGIVI